MRQPFLRVLILGTRNSSDRYILQCVTGASIHLREKNIAGPTERSAMHMHC
jgi:hypothetical protein